MQQIQSTYCKWIESAAHPGPLLRFWKMDPSLLGALRAGAVTVRQFEVSSRVCSRCKPLVMGPLPRFWKMDASLPGGGNTMVVTVGYKMSSGVFSPVVCPWCVTESCSWRVQTEREMRRFSSRFVLEA